MGGLEGGGDDPNGTRSGGRASAAHPSPIPVPVMTTLLSGVFRFAADALKFTRGGCRGWAMKWTRSCLGLVLLLVPAIASSVPATVSVFEAAVYTEPDPGSPVILLLPESTPIAVAETGVNGFRAVRLPDGRMGYIAENAISLAPAQAQPPGFPPGAPPPPPLCMPPLPPPPQGEVVRDPSSYRHVGFFMRFDLGFGYMRSTTSPDQTLFIFDTSEGPAATLAAMIGGAVRENLILGVEVWASLVESPSLRFRGNSIPSNGSFGTGDNGIGPNLTVFFMPANVYVSVTPALTWMSIGTSPNEYDTNTGFGGRFAIGKQWWTGPHWTLGVSGWFTASSNPEGGGSTARWQTYAGGLTFTTTLH